MTKDEFGDLADFNDILADDYNGDEIGYAWVAYYYFMATRYSQGLIRFAYRN